jgi:hypothetical protein
MTQRFIELSMVKAFQIALDNELGGSRAGEPDGVTAREIMDKAADRYDDLYAERRRYDNRALAKHLEESILPGIALYQALLDDPDTQQRSMDLVEVSFGEWAASRRKALEPLARRPLFYWLMRFTTKAVTGREYPEEGWDIEWLEVSGEQIAYNINRCFYLDVLLEYDVPELTAQYCRVDDLIYEGLSPHARWDRKKALGRGDDCCDFRFERVKGR